MITNEIAKVCEDLKKYQQQSFKDIMLLLGTGIYEIIKTYDIQEIYWRQYTPYFNDGDRCEFESFHYYPGIIIGRDVEAEMTLTAKVTAEFRILTNPIPLEFFEAIFGNDVIVTFKKDSFTTKSYTDHD
jgi:hypothetical protein